MQYDDLLLFLDLFETRNYGRSSARCNISTSALSRRVTRMEEELGVALFARDNRSVTPTAAGTEFERYARSVIGGWTELKERLSDRDDRVDGEIRIYASVTACYSILPDILRRFRSEYPLVHIHLKTGDAARAIQTVLDDEVDLSVAALPGRIPARLESVVLTTTPLVWIGPAMACAVREQLQVRPIPWERIPVVLSEQGLARRRVDRWYRELGVDPPIYAQVAGNEAIIAMVSLGCGVGVVPQLVVDKSPLRDDLQIISDGPALDPYHVGIAIQRRRLQYRAVAAFRDTARLFQREG